MSGALELVRASGLSRPLTADEVFEAVFEAGTLLSDADRESEPALEISIRLLEAQRVGYAPPGCDDAINFLAEECGLYPYLELDSLTHLTRALVEAHGVDLKEKVYLHSKQMRVLLWLLGGDSVVLSAPTSFGKTLLVDAAIKLRQPHTVVLILPTIALIDECRRRIESTFRGQYKIVTNSVDKYDDKLETIFILTQERFIQRKDILSIDFLFVDEFYKLDPDRDDGRYEALNLALYKALPLSKQCFMAGPNIKGIDLGEHWRGNFRFYKTDYRTVTVNVIDRSSKEGKFDAFLEDIRSVAGESSLVFTSVPRAAETLMADMMSAGIAFPTKMGGPLADWVAKNYHPNWAVAFGTAKGIGVHHGRVPRSLGQLFVRLFDSGDLPVLICTSTLIEGVNTAAANVFVYDKKINRSDFDFFSFSNIRGRVGRMMRHFVGNAFLYHEPPPESEANIDVPILVDPGSSTDYVVMNVEREELSPSGRERFDRIPVSTGLPQSILRDHGGIGTPLLEDLHERVVALARADASQLVWTNFPARPQRLALAELALLVAHKRREVTGLHTPKQINWAWMMLRYNQSLPVFLNWFVSTFDGAEQGHPIDAAFQFLQACEFSFVRTIGTVEALARYTLPDREINYGAFLSGLENWFRPPWMKQLDEAGIPMPLAERLQRYVGNPSSGSEAIVKIRALREGLSGLDAIDEFILRHQRSL